MRSILVDLGALFEESNLTAYTISNTEMLNKDIVAIFRSRLDRIASRILAIKITASERISSARHENFSDPTRMVFNGTTLSGDNELILDSLSQESRTYNSGPDILSVEKVILPAGVAVDSVTHPDQDFVLDYTTPASPKKDIPNQGDTNKDMMVRGIGNNFWREVILTDRPVVHYVSGEKFDGIVAVIKIDFTKPRDINSIIIDPFTERDLEIFRVVYRAQDGLLYEAALHNNEKVSAKSNTRIHLKNIVNIERSRGIQIWFLQRNFKRKTVKIDGNKFYENQIWTDMLGGEYNDIASRYAPGDLTQNPRDYEIDRVAQFRSYDVADQKLTTSSDPDKTVRDILNLEEKEDIFMDRVEYTLGAYAIEPQDLFYQGDEAGIFVSHKEGDGYIADIKPVTQIEIDVDFDTPSLSTIEFYIEDQEGRVEIPLVPARINEWKERVHPSGVDDNFSFTTLFPVVDGTMGLIKNGKSITPTLIQSDVTGSLSSHFTVFGADIREDDIFMARYNIQHDNRVTNSQRRDSVMVLRE